ncbi:hypothetical protein B0T17DRAFT_208778 [Bombardia bombarda]|uniref:Uncharacterized protein n=1 Tax=Bombardia bombarda TaxID=252184 RepID=A0AA39X9Y9_9PEZI|nr:hypothetical protein B0T17DRAFT_208778 [Bombardia bombarda]
MISSKPVWVPGRGKISHRLVQVPKDQQILFGRDDVWDLTDFPILPAEVLQGLKEFYSRSVKAPRSVSPDHTAQDQNHTEKAPRREPRQRTDTHGIPNDQRILLGSDDAWESTGLPNLPPQVLQGLREFHSQAFKAPQSNSPNHTARFQDRTEKTPPREPNPSAATQDIPWTPSPEHHFRKPVPKDRSGRDRSDAEAPSPRQPSPLQPSSSRWPSSRWPSPPLPSPRQPSPRHQAKRPALKPVSAPLKPAFPPTSSLASEPELPVELPQPITDIPKPINIAAVPVLSEPTPPSAQIIPCTQADRASHAGPPEPKRRRLMKPIAPGFSNPSNSSGAPTSTAANPLPLSASVLKRTSHLQSSGSERLPPNGPPSQAPFVAFQVAYPDYEGSLKDYLRGVISLLGLRKNRSLQEYAYDDYVHVFCREYTDYIRVTLDMDEQPLNAVKYYHEYRSKPLHTKGILNKTNLDDILDKYPDQVDAIYRTLEKPKEVDSTSSRQHTPAVVLHQKTPQTPQVCLSMDPKPVMSASSLSPDVVSRFGVSQPSRLVQQSTAHAMNTSTPFRSDVLHQSAPERIPSATATRRTPSPMAPSPVRWSEDQSSNMVQPEMPEKPSRYSPSSLGHVTTRGTSSPMAPSPVRWSEDPLSNMAQPDMLESTRRYSPSNLSHITTRHTSSLMAPPPARRSEDPSSNIVQPEMSEQTRRYGSSSLGNIHYPNPTATMFGGTQQSNPESIAEPTRPPNRAKKRIPGLRDSAEQPESREHRDKRWKKFLTKNLSNSMPNSSAQK